MKNITFTPSHYAQCIGCYEVDITDSCTVNCCYCSLKNKIEQENSSTQIPADIKEKGIYLSPNSDPFSPLARDDAHDILATFLPQGVPFLIITKSYIPQRTIDLLAQYSSQVYMQISLSRMDATLNSIIEPGAISAENKLEMIRSLIAIGVKTVPVLMPLFPGIDDTEEALGALISACAEAGAKYLKASYVVIDIRNPNQIKKLMSDPILKKSFLLMDEYIKIHIGGGLTISQEYRMASYKRLAGICAQQRISFQACPILDPAVLSTDIPLCATYRKKNKLIT